VTSSWFSFVNFGLCFKEKIQNRCYKNTINNPVYGNDHRLLSLSSEEKSTLRIKCKIFSVKPGRTRNCR